MGGQLRLTAAQWQPPSLRGPRRGGRASPPPPPEECQLFNMETALARLETMFQKAESDLDYIQHRLEFEIMKSLPDNLSAEENPVTLLEELSVVKSRYKTLCMQLEKVSLEQKESMNGIRAALENTMKMVQTLQQHADLQRSPLSEEEQTAAQQLTCQTVKEMESLVEEPFGSGSVVPSSVEVLH
ncbi:spindle and kinetochore-associated protein 2 isoform X3 [Anas platyrhynchos]|uniref:spindle and kinetochore-associated protein 2 isoform X3 n=1 Tax=Anas platyrhynchos TaxID=8839 RepID=UPI003AF2722D